MLVFRVLDGKHYNCAIRVHKCIYEALLRLMWAHFLIWIENDGESHSAVVLFLEQMNSMASDLNQSNFDKLFNSQLLSKIMDKWNYFLHYLRCDNGELSAYWMSYIDMVENVILCGSREGNWDLHLNAMRSLIPWCFAYDKVNYARYLTVYYVEMLALPESKPDVHQAFCAGQFSVQLSCLNPFGRIPVDQATEVTVNKDTQTPGGTTGFSLKPGAVQHFYMTSEYQSAFLAQIRYIVDGKKENFSILIYSRQEFRKMEKLQQCVS